jgi:hypothetical protein
MKHATYAAERRMRIAFKVIPRSRTGQAGLPRDFS